MIEGNKNLPIKENEPKTPEEILRDAANNFSRLDREAEDALLNKDSNIYRQKLEEKAGLIIALPNRLSKSIKDGQSFSEENMREVSYFSREAQEALKAKTTFSLGALLIPYGSKVGDPNRLERLIAKTYPPKTLPVK